MMVMAWKRAGTICAVLVAASFAGSVYAQTTPATGEVAKAQQLFEAVEGRFDALQTLQYTVERTTSSARHSTLERWIFRYRKPGDLRIDYQLPEARVIIVTGAALIEYLPSARKALRTDLSKLKPEEKAQRIGAVLARVSVEGLRVGDTRAMLSRVQAVTADAQQAGALWVEGAGPRFRVLVDPARRSVLSTELWDARDDVRLRTLAADFVEAAPGQWFPQRIDVVYGTEAGTVTSVMRLSDIHVNVALAGDVFDFAPVKGVTLQER
jgi:outer membrane lipoprotein-sorting protein